MPPGCSPSDIPGNRPQDFIMEEVEEQLFNALYAAMRNGFSVDNITGTLAQAAEEAYYDEMREIEEENAMFDAMDRFEQAAFMHGEPNLKEAEED